MQVGTDVRAAGRDARSRGVPLVTGLAEAADPGLAADLGPSIDEACRYQVFDGSGQFVGVFGNWDAAHAWGHRQAAEPRTPLPIRIEDRLDRRTWTVEPGRCQLTVRRRQPERGAQPVPWLAESVAS